MKYFNSLWWITLLFGIAIYIFFRDHNLLYNSILSFNTPLDARLLNFVKKKISFFIYSLPNGLWSMSFSQLIFLLRKDFTKKTVLFSYSMFYTGLIWEFFQFNGIIPGTFDFYDIIFNFLFCTFSYSINKLKNERF